MYVFICDYYLFTKGQKKHIFTKKIAARVGKPESELQDPVFITVILQKESSWPHLPLRNTYN
jgi:hypothetical protein